MENTRLLVVAHYFAQPTMGDRVNDTLGMLVETTRSEPENITCEFFRSMEDDDRLVAVGTHRCTQGPGLHRQTEYSQRIGIGIIISLLERKEVKSFHIPLDEPRR